MLSDPMMHRKLSRVPHIFLFCGSWRYIPARLIAYNAGINAAANAFCVGLNHRKFGDRLF